MKLPLALRVAARDVLQDGAKGGKGAALVGRQAHNRIGRHAGHTRSCLVGDGHFLSFFELID